MTGNIYNINQCVSAALLEEPGERVLVFTGNAGSARSNAYV